PVAESESVEAWEHGENHPVVYGRGGYHPEVVSAASNPITVPGACGWPYGRPRATVGGRRLSSCIGAARAGQNVQSGSGPRQVAELFPAVAVTWHGSAAPTGVRPGMAEGTQKDPPQELDLELVRRVQRGETAAFDLLVRKYQHRI